LELQKKHDDLERLLEEEKARRGREAQEKEEELAEALQSEKQKQLEAALQVKSYSQRYTVAKFTV
jgi:hypothetical protein